jgi:hypothetical protein
MVVSDIAEFPMLTLVMVSFLVVTAATGIGFLAWLYDVRHVPRMRRRWGTRARTRVRA